MIIVQSNESFYPRMCREAVANTRARNSVNEHYFLILRMKLSDNGFSTDRNFNRDSSKNKSKEPTTRNNKKFKIKIINLICG